jgi:hypothetical protein
MLFGTCKSISATNPGRSTGAPSIYVTAQSAAKFAPNKPVLISLRPALRTMLVITFTISTSPLALFWA